jgi:drug/metabolite transporter (DMT)-like permease
MKFRDLVELLVLAALWGGSFLFMRILAPVIGPWATADLRMVFGGLFLVGTFGILRKSAGWKEHWRVYLLIGVVNSALPFACYSLAALVLPASVEVIVNALSPAFGAVAGALFLGERLTFRKGLGLAAGVAGVLVVAGGLDLGSSPWAWAALGVCLLAPACYAAGGILVKSKATAIPASALALGSQTAAGLLFLPSLALPMPAGAWSAGPLALAAVFGILCSGVAYLLYYGLMARLGPTKTLTVTFLMPVFGVLWGALFLGEPVTLTLALGGLLILAGTGAVALPRR